MSDVFYQRSYLESKWIVHFDELEYTAYLNQFGPL